MDIRSKSSPSEAASVYEARKRAESDARAQQEQERRARQAEEDAQRRIHEAKHRADEAVQDIERRSNAQRAEGNARLATERGYIRDQMERTKAEGYQQLRELKRRTDAEVAVASRDGERAQEEIEEHYRHEIEETTKKSAKAAREAYQRNLRDLEKQDALVKAQREAYQEIHGAEMRTLQKMHEDARTSQTEKARNENEELRRKIEDARVTAEKKFNDQFSRTVGQHEESLNQLNLRAGKQLEELRSDGARKLATYESRQEDPFYRMVNLDAELSDAGDAFILRARIPRHEQDNVKAQVQGQQIVVTGARRAQDQVQLGEGRSRSSSSYQTFRETFPIDWPVDAATVLRESNGDELIFTFSKRTGMVDPETGGKKPLDAQPFSRHRAPRPDFPEDLVAPAPPYKGSPIS
jgi:HSP20 family molecular chaperone IbpA